MNRSLLALLFSAASFSVTAQTRVSDLRPGSLGSRPDCSVELNGKLYFIANDGSAGNELYSYDGVNPPVLINDLAIGLGNGLDTPASTNSIINFRLGVLNNKIYFNGGYGNTASELYCYDPATGAQTLVEDIYTGRSGSAPLEFITLDNKLYFVATSSSAGRELMSYDGTKTAVIDMEPGLSGIFPSYVSACNGKIYFCGSDYYDGEEPYEYNPVTGSKKRIADIQPGQHANSYPRYFTEFGGKVYFIANEYQYGYELYEYDGTRVRRLTDLISQIGSGVTNVFNYNGTMMLSACTNNATYMLHTFDPATNKALAVTADDGIPPLGPSRFIAYNGKLYFSGVHPTLGRELYVYDGNSTSLVMDINPGSAGSSPSNFAILNGQLVFSADDGVGGRELFKMGAATGIERAGFIEQAIIYPNPTSQDCALKLSLKQPASVFLTVTDASGKTVYTSATVRIEAAGEIAVPAQAFAAGSYFYQLRSAAGGLLSAGKLQKR